jgi:hypothetical protein
LKKPPFTTMVRNAAKARWEKWRQEHQKEEEVSS